MDTHYKSLEARTTGRFLLPFVFMLFFAFMLNSASAQSRQSSGSSPSSPSGQTKAPAMTEAEKIEYLKQNHPDQYLDYLRVNNPDEYNRMKATTVEKNLNSTQEDETEKAKERIRSIEEARVKKEQEKKDLYNNNLQEYKRVYNVPQQKAREISYEEYLNLSPERKAFVDSNPDKVKIKR